VSEDFLLKTDFAKIASEIPSLFGEMKNLSTTVLPIPIFEKDIP